MGAFGDFKGNALFCKGFIQK